MSLSAAARRLTLVGWSLSRRSSSIVSKTSSRTLPSLSRDRTQRREITSSSVVQPLRSENKVTVNFINRDGEKITVKASPGESLLDVVVDQDLDFDGFGACEGTLACSTCHIIFEEETYKQLGPISDEEMDMLDLAYGLTDTSRLGCQICLTKSLDGVTVRLPESVADIRQSDGSA
ncbi:adrenodoxin-like [Colossoma macropomum]|uniref:adrenodoxin-like n=1 Tax=Colossoma macropomum TaxID=42526 RepID=UPI0018647424|nr:adrenodoxin-like [Colossoma macropomum]